MSENEEIVNVSTPVRYKVPQAAKRQLRIAISDLIAAKDSFENSNDFFTALGKLYAQMDGTEPYEAPTMTFKKIEHVTETVGEPVTTAYFYAPKTKLREGKLYLNKAFDLIHYPPGKKFDTEVRYAIKDVTKKDAWAVFNASNNLFTKIDFLSDMNAAKRAIVQAQKPVTTRTRKIKNAPAPVKQADLLDDTLANEIIEEKIEEQQTVEEHVDLLIDEQLIDEKPVEEKSEKEQEDEIEELFNNNDLLQ